MGGWNRLDHDLAAILAFVFALALLDQAPWLLAVLGGLAFVAWTLDRLGVFDDEGGEAPEPDPLSALQTRYANGEIDDAEFERRLERILESDGVARGESTLERDPDRAPKGGLDRRSDRDDGDRDVETA